MKLTDMARHVLRTENELLLSDDPTFTEEEFVEKIKLCNVASNIVSPLALTLNKHANILFLILYYNKLLASNKLNPNQVKRLKTLLFKQEDELFELCDSKYYKKNSKFSVDEFESTENSDDENFSTGDQDHPTNSVRSVLGLDN